MKVVSDFLLLSAGVTLVMGAVPQVPHERDSPLIVHCMNCDDDPSLSAACSNGGALCELDGTLSAPPQSFCAHACRCIEVVPSDSMPYVNCSSVFNTTGKATA
ncbi:hypothetical protein QBC46DRAFT_348227 [Diplogelasinospora grovesii]|uniref:Uncharacterized protein n=1 Tax=Diplogelasinospora grovesii TaxID=303347 RepID=A0AAN6MUP0_9PEZI|nr:hypothetical protein QBC46DRAFT_348227 [Diplogelasinospora grovesii]